MLRNHYLIEHWTMADFGKNLTELRKARGASASQPLQYDIRNKTFQARCKKVDALRQGSGGDLSLPGHGRAARHVAPDRRQSNGSADPFKPRKQTCVANR